MVELKNGDLIQIHTSKEIYEGIYLPSPETGLFLLKLENGYNIGFNKKDILKIKIKKRYKEVKEDFEIPKSKKPNIVLVSLGGTIASRLNPGKGGVDFVETPKDLFIHGYFTIDGKKMSKTLGNVIDPNDLVEEFGVDAARYLIISQFPFGQDGDVKLEEFKVKFNSDLANGLGNLVSRVLSMSDKYCDSKIPDKEYNAEVDLKKLWVTIDKNYSEYRVFENLKEIWQLIAWCDGYIAETKPWALAKDGKDDEVNQIVYNLIEILRHLGWLVNPILPLTAKEILKRVGEGESTFEQSVEIGKSKPGGSIDKGDALFQRM